MPSTEDSLDRSTTGLALQRTALANERTLLAYSRTAIMLAASGVTLLKLGSSSPFDRGLAGTLLLVSVVVLAFGVGRFRAVKRSLGDT